MIKTYGYIHSAFICNKKMAIERNRVVAVLKLSRNMLE